MAQGSPVEPAIEAPLGTMRAIACHGPGDHRLEEVPTPRAGPGEVVVREVASQ
jgi:hypothetical protein